jgi:hypothetical protein
MSLPTKLANFDVVAERSTVVLMWNGIHSGDPLGDLVFLVHRTTLGRERIQIRIDRSSDLGSILFWGFGVFLIVGAWRVFEMRNCAHTN